MNLAARKNISEDLSETPRETRADTAFGENMLYWVHTFFQIFFLASVYFLAAKLGLKLAYIHPSSTIIWPPSGIALSALLIMGWEVWPGIFIGAFFANLTRYC